MMDCEKTILEKLEAILGKLEEINRRIELIDNAIKSYQQNAVSVDDSTESKFSIAPDYERCSEAKAGQGVELDSETGTETEAETETGTEIEIETVTGIGTDPETQTETETETETDIVTKIDTQMEQVPSIESQIESNTELHPEHEAKIEIEEAVIDRMKPKIPSWKTDMPGMKVDDVNNAISLNDRIFFITELFADNPDLFKRTILQANDSDSFEQFESYIYENFPDWDMESEAVYRLMMLARRKLT